MKRYNAENNGENVIDIQKRREERNSHKKKSKRKMLILLAFVAVIALLMSPYFNVKWIDVKGNSIVTASQIRSASNIILGKNMFIVNIKKSKDMIKAIPYIDDVHIYRHPRGGMIVKVTERAAFAYIKNPAGNLIIDREGRVLEIAGKDYDYSSVIEITGLKIGKLKPGDVIGENYAQNLKMAEEIAHKLKENKIEDRVTSINVKNINNVSMMFDNDKEVILGDSYRTEYKLAMLESTLASLAPSEKGTIDLTVEGRALFTPKE